MNADFKVPVLIVLKVTHKTVFYGIIASAWIEVAYVSFLTEWGNMEYDINLLNHDSVMYTDARIYCT